VAGLGLVCAAFARRDPAAGFREEPCGGCPLPRPLLKVRGGLACRVDVTDRHRGARHAGEAPDRDWIVGRALPEVNQRICVHNLELSGSHCRRARVSITTSTIEMQSHSPPKATSRSKDPVAATNAGNQTVDGWIAYGRVRGRRSGGAAGSPGSPAQGRPARPAGAPPSRA
jgi:hypothetical protein